MKKDCLKDEDFKSIKTIYDILEYAKNNYADKIAYRQILENDLDSSITYKDFIDNVERVKASFLKKKINGKHCALIGECSIEWLTSYFSIVTGAGICVPIDKELNSEDIIKQLNIADIEIVFVSKKYIKKVFDVLDKCQNVKTIILLNTNECIENIHHCKVFCLNDLISIGSKEIKLNNNLLNNQKIDENALCTIIFTSGTTGANKGVMLSNKNIITTIRGAYNNIHPLDVSLSILPVNHAYELHVQILISFFNGSCVCINNEPRYFIRNMRRFHPNFVLMVPMMLDSIVSQIKSEIKKKNKKQKFDKIVQLSNKLIKIGIDLRRLFFKEIIDSFGGQIKYIVCGGTNLNIDTAKFLTSIGIDVYNGYGITECGPVVAVNPTNDNRLGSVGRVLFTNDVRIEKIGNTNNGEIQVKGDNVMLGYYNDKKSNALSFTEDGWFKTGDIGYLDKDQYLYILGRIKNLIILPNGENVYPESIEEQLCETIPLIKECLVVENKNKTGLYCYIYPDLKLCKKKCLNNADDIRQHFQENINKYNDNNPSYKRLVDFEILEKEFEKNTTEKILRYKTIENLRREKC